MTFFINPTLHPKHQVTLVGHQEAYAQIQQSFYNKTIPPVWLISGNKGVGKATFAYTLAREILSQEAPNKNLLSHQMAHGSYPNFLSLERSPNADGKMMKEITSEEGRKVNHFLRQCAALPGWRVILIDAIDEMNRTAAHALLKILEEPPAKTIFFLITHCLGAVLPTIRSRCCKIALSPLSQEDLQKSIGNQIPETLLPLAQGSIGRLLALQEAGGILLLDQIIQTMVGALKNDWRPLQALCSSLDKDNPHYEVILDLILGTLYRLIILMHMSLPHISSDQKLNTLSQMRSASHWVDAFYRINHFLNIARTSHLDRSHVLTSIFFMIENPKCGDTFIHDSF